MSINLIYCLSFDNNLNAQHNEMPIASNSVIIELKLKVNYKRIPISV